MSLVNARTFHWTAEENFESIVAACLEIERQISLVHSTGIKGRENDGTREHAQKFSDILVLSRIVTDQGEQPESASSRSSRWECCQKEAWRSLWPWHIYMSRLQNGERGLFVILN